MSKLVRDFIVYDIQESGKSCKWRYADPDEQLTLLALKLKEETTELIKAVTKEEVLEEIADVMEVMEAVAKKFGITKDAIIAAQNKKRAERGGFTQFVVLEAVKE